MMIYQNKKSGASQINLTGYETEKLSTLLKWYLSNTTDTKKTTEFFRKLSDEISEIFKKEVFKMEDVRMIFTRAAEYECKDCKKIIKPYSKAYETVDDEEIICEDCYNDNCDYRDINP